MKEEAVGRGLWRTPFGRAYGLVIRQATLLLLLLLLLLYIETSLCVMQLRLDGSSFEHDSMRVRCRPYVTLSQYDQTLLKDKR
jgi:hypothetical protein